MKEAVVRGFPASIVAELERCAVNEAGDGRKRKEGFRVETVECCPAELDSSPASAIKFLSDAGQVT